MLVEPADARHLLSFGGGTAELWHFSPSHARLVLRLRSTDTQTHGYLVFVFLDHVRAPAAWRLRAPRIGATDEGGVEFVDDEVEVVARELVFQREYEVR
jgi:hypothetical protein